MNRPLILLTLLMMAFVQNALAQQEYFQLKIYHLQNAAQGQALESFLRETGIPALHKAGVRKVGVFVPVAEDSIRSGKLVMVLLPYRSLGAFEKAEQLLMQNSGYTGTPYFNAAHDQPAYGRIESVLMRAFTGMTSMAAPVLTGSATEKVYELRSYESPSEKLYVNKVNMFNEGDEIGLFKELNFNAVFYAEVLSGAHMPNLMYMTSFNSMSERDEHWKKFFAHPKWKVLLAMPQYQHNVSKADIYLLHPAPCSEL